MSSSSASHPAPIRVLLLGGTFLMGALEDGLYYPIFTLHDILLADAALHHFAHWRAHPNDPSIIAHIEQRYADMTGQPIANPMPPQLDETKLAALEAWILGEGDSTHHIPPGLLRQTFTREWHRTAKGEHLQAKHFGHYLLQADRYAVAHLLGITPTPALPARWGGHAYGQQALEQAVANLQRQQLQAYPILPDVLYPLGELVDSLNLTDSPTPPATSPDSTDASNTHTIRALIAAVRACLQRGEYPLVIGGTDTLEWYASAVALALGEAWQQAGMLFVSAMQGFGQNPQHVAGLWRAAMQVHQHHPTGCHVLVAEDASVQRWHLLDAAQPFTKISAAAECWQAFRQAEKSPLHPRPLPHIATVESLPWRRIFPPLHADTPVRHVIGWLQSLTHRHLLTRHNTPDTWHGLLLAGIPREALSHSGMADALTHALAQAVQAGLQVSLYNPYQGQAPLWSSPLQPALSPKDAAHWRKICQRIGAQWLEEETLAHAYWRCCWTETSPSPPCSGAHTPGQAPSFPVAWERLALYSVPLIPVMQQAIDWLLRDVHLKQLVVVAPPSGVLPEVLAYRLQQHWRDWHPPRGSLQVTTAHAGLQQTAQHPHLETTHWHTGAVYAPVRVWRQSLYACSRGDSSVQQLVSE